MTSSDLDLTGLLRPVREGNAFEETVERLLTVIKLGLVGPGARFPSERELAAQFGISRLTLREAIRELQQAGYVESRRGRAGGTFVTGAPPAPDRGELRRLAREEGDRLTDALTFRLALETGAAEALAQLMAPVTGTVTGRVLGPDPAGRAGRGNPREPGGPTGRPGQADGSSHPTGWPHGRSCCAGWPT